MASNGDGAEAGTNRFDPVKWSLRELDLDDLGRALANGATDLIASEAWQERFAEKASMVATLLEKHLKDRLAGLEAEAAETDTEAAARGVRLEEERQQAEQEEKDRQRPQNPSVLKNVYQAALRVSVRGEKSVGVRGITVRLAADPGSPALAEAVTDDNGNAVLAVPADNLPEGGAVVMAVPTGGAEARPIILQRNVRAKPSQVDVFRAEIQAEQGFETEVEVAERSAAGRQARLDTLAERLDQVSTVAAARRAELDAELAAFKALLQIAEPAPVAPPAPAPAAARSAARSAAPKPKRSKAAATKSPKRKRR